MGNVKTEIYTFMLWMKNTGCLSFLRNVVPLAMAYAIGDTSYEPFTYTGTILEPVMGWMTHHSIAEFKGKWYLFYHDSSLPGGRNHLRCVKCREIVYDEQGHIKLAEPQGNIQEAQGKIEKA